MQVIKMTLYLEIRNVFNLGILIHLQISSFSKKLLSVSFIKPFFFFFASQIKAKFQTLYVNLTLQNLN